MDFRAIISDFLKYYIIFAVVGNAAVFAIEKYRNRRYLPYYLWINVSALLLFVIMSWSRHPSTEPLTFDVAFYALREAEESDSQYLQWSLQKQGGPEDLGTRDTLGSLSRPRGVTTNDHAQMRVRLNLEGYVCILHFDTSFNVKRLYPAITESFQRQIQPGSWLECPPGVDTWIFDEQKGLEVFVLVVSDSPAKDLVASISKIVSENRAAIVAGTVRSEDVIQKLRQLAACSYVKSGVYSHDQIDVEPAVIVTNSYEANDKESAVLVVTIRNE